MAAVATRVHQALHGYSDGHRELASSISLSPKESKLVLVMSDVSGPGVASEGLSYLTGYPLPEAGVYAVAKTWPAAEMSRPGCVWTHTLFVDFADLASIDFPSRIARHFARPSPEGWARYGKSLSIDFSEQLAPEVFDPSELEWLSRVLNALYSAPHERVLARRKSGIAVESLVLDAWDQQWPRLRRSFRFCTLTTKDRSVEGGAFDLQVAPALEFGVRARIPGALDATDVSGVSSSSWLSSLIADIQEPNVSGLRTSLRMLGADILAGREAMRDLCEFHALTAAGQNASNIDLAVSAVTGPQPLTASRVAKTRVVQLALDRIADLSDSSLRYLVEHLALVDSASLNSNVNQIALAVWKWQPQKLLEMLQDEETTKFAEQAIRELPVEAVIDEWSRVINPHALLETRADLLETPLFWSTPRCSSSAVTATNVNLNSEPIILAMLQGIEDEGDIADVANSVDQFIVLSAMQEILASKGTVSSERQWAKYSSRHTSSVARFLSETAAPSGRLLELISEELQPDAIPNDYGHDPWFTALRRLSEAEGRLSIRLNAYGFRRALGWRSRSVAELLQLTFEPLYKAAAESAIDDSIWSPLEEELPRAPTGHMWDKCLRLRQAVAKQFVRHNLWTQIFAAVTSDDEVFCFLLDDVLNEWGGRRYLRTLEDSLKDERNPPLNERRVLVREFLRKRKRPW